MKGRGQRHENKKPGSLRTERRKKADHSEQEESPHRDFMHDEEDHVGYPQRGPERVDWDTRHTHSYDDYDSRREASNRPSYDEERGPIYGAYYNHAEERPNFSGRGPKGFIRSDERIKEDVCERLARNSFIDASDIEVEVKNGEVTLSGTIPDRRMKHLAEDLVENSLSVKDVFNNIHIKKVISPERRDLPSKANPNH